MLRIHRTMMAAGAVFLLAGASLPSNLTISAASIRTVTVTPFAVVGGENASARITLDSAAPPGAGITVQLAVSNSDGSVRSASDPLPATVPATVHIPPHASFANVPVTTTPVARDQSLRITATLGASTNSGTLVIEAPVVSSVSLNPSTVVSGSPATGTVTLTGPAPAPALVTALAASNSNASVPPLIAVDAGKRSQTFQVITLAKSGGAAGSNTVTISARAKVVREAAARTTTGTITDGTSNTIQLSQATPAGASAVLTLLSAPALASFTLRPTKVKGGLNVIAEFQLTPQMTSAQVITLTTDRTDLIQLPATVTVPVSPVPTPFTFTTLSTQHEATATVTASAGSQSIPVVLTVKK